MSQLENLEPQNSQEIAIPLDAIPLSRSEVGYSTGQESNTGQSYRERLEGKRLSISMSYQELGEYFMRVGVYLIEHSEEIKQTYRPNPPWDDRQLQLAVASTLETGGFLIRNQKMIEEDHGRAPALLSATFASGELNDIEIHNESFGKFLFEMGGQYHEEEFERIRQYDEDKSPLEQERRAIPGNPWAVWDMGTRIGMMSSKNFPSYVLDRVSPLSS